MPDPQKMDGKTIGDQKLSSPQSSALDENDNEIDDLDEELELSFLQEDEAHDCSGEAPEEMGGECKEIPALDGSFLEIQDEQLIGKVYHECSVCGKKFKIAGSLRRHLKVHQEGTVKCSYCATVFESQEDLTAHSSKYHFQRYVCEKCGKDCKTKQALNRHTILKHDGDGKERKVCPFPECGKVVPRRTYYEDHMNSHIKIRPYKCENCDKSFLCRYEKNRHHKNCGQSLSYPCNECSRVFSQRQNLHAHRIAEHKIRLHACICGKQYKYASGLLRHKTKKRH